MSSISPALPLPPSKAIAQKETFHFLRRFNNGARIGKPNRGNESMLRFRCCIAASPQNLQFPKAKTEKSEKTIRIGVLGASGYTGSEIVRLLANHPYFEITLMTADRKAGQSIGSVFPHLITQDLPKMVAIKDADFSNVDAVFCCLPHGTTQEIIKGLPTILKIVDLSADFRLRDIVEYEEWYGQPHRAPDLQKDAVYGLTEISREEIRSARLVANPGCYPTSIQLPLIPLIKAQLIELRNIIIDSKSGVSGAGRGAKEANLYTEVAEGIHSYGVTRHRHVPEIEQGLTDASHAKVMVSITPHLMPMSRGMQSTIYVEMTPGVTVEDLYQQLRTCYEDEEFVILLEKGVVPHTRNVRGSNYCFMNVFPDRIPGRAIIISVIDNLVKGASGQALQNINLMMGFPESTGGSHHPHKFILVNLWRSMETLRSLWHCLLQPVKSFPWDRAFGHFVEIIFELISSAIEYLCVPLLAVSSLSELSCRAHERKLILTPSCWDLKQQGYSSILILDLNSLSFPPIDLLGSFPILVPSSHGDHGYNILASGKQ